MKIISKSRIGMASDKLTCDKFMKKQNKIKFEQYYCES